MKKKIIIILLFIISDNISYGLNEINLKGIPIPDNTNFSNSKLYISNELVISNYSLEIFKSGNGLKINKFSNLFEKSLLNLGEEESKKLLNEKLLIVGNDVKLELFKNDPLMKDLGNYDTTWNFESNINEITLDKKELLTFYNKIYFNASNQYDNSKIKWYPINPENGAWYSQYLDKDYPQIIIFDDILLPQNITSFFFYAKNVSDDKEYIEWGEKKLNVVKKYDIVYTKGLGEGNNIKYIIVPYYEIEIPFTIARPQNNEFNAFYLTFDIIEDIYFKYYNTNIQLYSNGSNILPIEFIKY